MPGEKVLAEITVLSPHFVESKLEVGMKFTINEGSKIIGTGKVIEILNEKMKKASP